MNIDIILIYESRLPSDTKLHITNDRIYTDDLSPVRGKPAYGDTTVLIHRRITRQPETPKTDIQTSSVCIVLNDHEVLISAIYKPPQATLISDGLDLLNKSTDW